MHGRRLGLELALLALVLVVAGILRYPGLSTPGYGVDEQLTAEEAIRLAETYEWRYWDIPTEKLVPLSGSMPVAYYTAAAGLAAFGNSLSALRLPFLVLGLFTILLTWAVARALTGSAVAGITAALFLSLNAAHIQYSQFARFYVPGMLVLLGWTLSLVWVLRSPSWRSSLVMGLLTAVGYLTYLLFPIAVFMGCAYGAFVCLADRHEERHARRQKIIVWMAVALVVSSPIFAANVLEYLAGSGSAGAEGHTHSLGAIAGSLVRFVGGGLLRIEPTQLLLALIGVFVLLRERRVGQMLPIFMAVGVPLCIAMLAFKLPIRGRYILFVLPWFSVLASVAVKHIWGTRPGKASALLVIAVVSLQLLDRSFDYLSHEDGRLGAAQMNTKLLRYAPEGSAVIVIPSRSQEALRLLGWNEHTASFVPPGDALSIVERQKQSPQDHLVIAVAEQSESIVEEAGLYRGAPWVVIDRVPVRSRRITTYWTIYRWVGP